MQIEQYAQFKKFDQDKQIVYAVVYAPNELDTYNDMMEPDEIERMAHNFMRRTDLAESIDTNHDYKSNGSFPIESFIARADDPDYPEGAWVLGVKVTDDAVWKDIKDGRLSGFSFAGYGKSVSAVAEVGITPSVVGDTESSLDHTHCFFVEIDVDGRILYGRTSMDLNHTHEIKSGTATEMSMDHSHRFFI